MRREIVASTAATPGVMLQPPLHCIGVGFMVVLDMAVVVVGAMVVAGASTKTLKELSPEVPERCTQTIV